MVNSRAAHKLKALETYLPTGTAATKTFTFPAIDWEKTAYLELQIDIAVTAALVLELIINGVVTQYYTDGNETGAGSTTIIDVGAIAHFQLISAALLAAGGASAGGTVKLFQNKTAGLTFMKSDFVNTSSLESRVSGVQNSDIDSITSLTVTTSTSTWTALTRMTLYQVYR